MLLAVLALLIVGTLCVAPLLQTLAIGTANPSSLRALGEVVRTMVEATRSSAPMLYESPTHPQTIYSVFATGG